MGILGFEYIHLTLDLPIRHVAYNSKSQGLPPMLPGGAHPV